MHRDWTCYIVHTVLLSIQEGGGVKKPIPLSEFERLLLYFQKHIQMCVFYTMCTDYIPRCTYYTLQTLYMYVCHVLTYICTVSCACTVHHMDIMWTIFNIQCTIHSTCMSAHMYYVLHTFHGVIMHIIQYILL